MVTTLKMYCNHHEEAADHGEKDLNTMTCMFWMVHYFCNNARITILARLAEKGVDPDKQPAESWDKAVWAREKWQEISGGRPFLIKGIQRVDDAEKAADLGFERIVVSNHAGRQVDGAIASLDALEMIAERVGDRLVVTFDSGVRRAADIVKTLALGAKFVAIGRLWIWGLSIMGEHGVSHVLKVLLADLDILIIVAGLNRVEDIDKDLLMSFPAGFGYRKGKL
ncbi:hypothetical protein FZEAL_1412 [Fusarium zealandicum]|uniref:FMN hydroxy acid dehydrogenase domain-containing protein n=1 Tax=Fusarium zealandicum TaxID=1053134 RepID=A0A8H4UST8_9HYPO|nr:hypothetical protein FZEAL_1412 [Fusarium zealandicum]